MPGVDHLLAPVAVVDQRHALQMILALAFQYRGVEPDVDVVDRLDLVDQIGRHRPLQGAAADEPCHLAACREKNTAAWPAELAPPTISTWSPAQACAWVAAEP